MQVQWKTPGKLLQLVAESAADLNVIGDLLIDSTLSASPWIEVPEAELPFGCSPTDGIRRVTTDPCSRVIGMVIDVDSSGARALRAKAGSQALSAIGDLVRLGFRQAAQDGHISANTTDPQTQEALAAGLVELKLMLQTVGEMVVKQEAAIKEVRRAHSGLLSSGNLIVTEGGAA